MSRRNTLRDLCGAASLRLCAKRNRGDAFLPGCRCLRDRIPASKKYRITRSSASCKQPGSERQGRTLRDISRALGFSKSTVYSWLLRLAVGGLKRIHDNKSPGRSCRLSVKQQNRLKRDLGKNPDQIRFSAWLVDCKDCRLSH